MPKWKHYEAEPSADSALAPAQTCAQTASARAIEGDARVVLGRRPEGPEIRLPLDATQKIAIVGVSDSGKSYAAGVAAEEWFSKGVPVAVVDPVGIWWGIRVAADREGRGMPFLLYGGLRGETLPEPWDAAWLFAVKDASCVFDLSALALEYVHYWGAQFFMKLMELGPRLSSPRQVFVEEAPVMAPQSGMTSKWCAQCRNSIAQLVRVGGNHGYGVTIVTQRAQAVDKNSLTQCGNLLLMRIAAALDRRAIADWVANNSSRKMDLDKELEAMASYKSGTGMLWAPSWADREEDKYGKIVVRKRLTFHPDRRDPMGNRMVGMAPVVRSPRPGLLAGLRELINGALR